MSTAATHSDRRKRPILAQQRPKVHGFRSQPRSRALARAAEGVYGRGSVVNGEFGDSWEYAGGVKWHHVRTERMWLNAEVMRVEKAPYTGTFTPYTSGLTGWVPMVQAILAF